MNCELCGNVLKPETRFCGKCGTKVNEQGATNSVEILDEGINFLFKAQRHLGRFVIQELNTNVCVEGDMFKYSQKTSTLYWFEKKQLETEHSIQDFVSIQCSRVIDLSFLVLAIITLFMAWYWEEFSYVIATGLFLWLGAGSKMVITKSNGAKIKIFSESHSEWGKLIENLIKQNKAIVVKA